MSELKAYIAPTPDGTGLADYYLKSEADKAIAELQKQVHDYEQSLYVIQARADKDARHHKYKRCLAMARWCQDKLDVTYGFRYKHFEEWKWRWLELAEQFKDKEAK